MTVVIFLSLSLLAIGAGLCVTRLVRGDSIANRMVALDTLLVVVVSGIAVNAAWTRSGVFLNLLVVVGLLGFSGTAMIAWFIERRGGE